jgi:nicotinate-nucleotide adenylyltransferase
MLQRMGILGGTFNPVHIGHLRAAEEAIEMLGLNAFLFVPAAAPPHKEAPDILCYDDRLEMLRLAVHGNPRFQLSEIERELQGKSYTVRTLGRLREQTFGTVELYFLVGMDAFLEIETWWRYKQLFSLAHIAVFRRPGYKEERLEPYLHRKVSQDYEWDAKRGCFRHPHLLPVHYLPTTCLEISSSQIRALLLQKRSIRYLVSDEIMRYIETKQIYTT